jgi:hypothetical protein
MTIADLKNKVQSAQEIARKHKNIRVVMTVEEATEESGKNIILTVILNFSSQKLLVQRSD